MPLVGTAAAIGLVLFFVCAIYTHVRAHDYSPQFALAIGFLALAVARWSWDWPRPECLLSLRQANGVIYEAAAYRVVG